MKAVPSLIVVLIAGAFQGLTTASLGAQPLCVGAEPAKILRCYTNAYALRDSASYVALLDTAYVSMDLSYPGQADFDYRTKRQLTLQMFRTPNIERLELEFGRPGRIEPDSVAASWVIRDVPCTLRLHGMADMGGPGPWTVRKIVSLWVRVAPEPEPHFVIFREELRDPEDKPADR